MNLVIGVYSVATAVWPVADLELVPLALVRFLVFAERGAMVYDCHDLGTGPGSCGMITPIPSGV